MVFLRLPTIESGQWKRLGRRSLERIGSVDTRYGMHRVYPYRCTGPAVSGTGVPQQVGRSDIVAVLHWTEGLKGTLIRVRWPGGFRSELLIKEKTEEDGRPRHGRVLYHGHPSCHAMSIYSFR